MKSTFLSTLAVGVTVLAIATGAVAADVDKLLKSLSDENPPSVRARAAYELGNAGDKSEAVILKLIDSVTDEDATVRQQAVRALIKLDPPVEGKMLEKVLEILQSGDRELIGPAMQTIVEEGEAVVPRLCGVLEKDENEEAWYWACVVLADIGPKAKDAVPAVKGVLKHKLEEVRMQALITLGEILAGSDQPPPDIVKVLTNEKESNAVKYAAAFALGQIGPDEAGTAALQETMESDDAFLELTAAWALASNNPGNKALLQRTVELIVDAFKSDDVNLRRAAAKMAVEFDVPLEDIAPQLIKALQDPDPRLVRNAIESLVDLGPKALTQVDELLKHPQLRFYALPLISRLGPDAEKAVPALITEIKKSPAEDPDSVEGILQAEEDANFRREAVFALAAIGPKAADAVPVLTDLLKSDDIDMVTSSSYALGMMGPKAKAAMTALRDNLRHEKPIVQFAAVSALFRILPGEPRLIPIARSTLVKLLSNEEAEVRFAAVVALGKMGRAADKALPEIRERLKDDSEMVREEAAKAIKQIGG